MLPRATSATAITTTNPTSNHRKTSLVPLQRFIHRPSNLSVERFCFLLVHLLFYLILLTIVWIKLDQVNQRQEKLFNHLRSTSFDNTSHSNRSIENPSLENCSCSTVTYPRRNRTTRCFQLRVGLTDTIENVFCPISNKNEAKPWLRIQQRESNQVDFNRTWNDYRRGFGDIVNKTDFWIGNENLHWLTTTFSCRLKIELIDWYNETRTATYETFRLANQQDGYRIHLADYHGDMEANNQIDTFSRRHHNARFSTWDHYATNINCPQLHSGSGWWYHSGSDCAHVQLNGRLATHPDGLVPFNTGIIWIGWKPDRHYSFQRVSMSIQPKTRRSRPSRR